MSECKGCQELRDENKTLRELVDAVTEVVEIYHVTFPAQIAWKKNWLAKAKEVLHGMEDGEMRELQTEEGSYPNPNYKWIEISLGDFSLGRADIEKNGYRPRPATKTVKTIPEAARKIAARELKQAKSYAKKWQAEVVKWTAISKELEEGK